jgi:putative ABC transport system permease protein
LEILPNLLALRRNKVGAALVVLQIALTLAVVANAMSIIQNSIALMHRPSGVDEANIFTLHNHWVGQPENLRASIEADLTALRAIPEVVDAEATSSFPLGGSGHSQSVRLKPDQDDGDWPRTATYFSDTHGMATLGLKLVGGRWFSPAEVADVHPNDIWIAPDAVLTAALARKLFPTGTALGQIIYLNRTAPTQVVGVVDRAATPWVGFPDFAVFVPFQFVNNQVDYVVRTKPGQLASVMRTAPDRLRKITRARVLTRIRSFEETRRRSHQIGLSESWLLGAVSGLLLVITGLGTIGLTAYWVSRRRRQIGLRRALGARRADILRYFHTENLLIAGLGALLGVGGGLGANLWMTIHLGTVRMNPMYIAVGAVIVLVLSQLAVIWPALRAAAVPPSLAARGL